MAFHDRLSTRALNHDLSWDGKFEAIGGRWRHELLNVFECIQLIVTWFFGETAWKKLRRKRFRQLLAARELDPLFRTPLPGASLSNPFPIYPI